MTKFWLIFRKDFLEKGSEKPDSVFQFVGSVDFL